MGSRHTDPPNTALRALVWLVYGLVLLVIYVETPPRSFASSDREILAILAIKKAQPSKVAPQ